MDPERDEEATSPAAPRAKHLPIVSEDSPTVVPARMVNEVLYCERLFYLEWVQGEFAHNEFTADGAQVHTTSDKPRGTVPQPDGVDAPFEARSLWLSSEKLGITAKIDVVEGDADGTVIPIEHKRGTALDVPERAVPAWNARSRARKLLLLREHGYNVPEAAIWFCCVAQTRDDHDRRHARANDLGRDRARARFGRSPQATTATRG